MTNLREEMDFIITNSSTLLKELSEKKDSSDEWIGRMYENVDNFRMESLDLQIKTDQEFLALWNQTF